MGKLNMSPGESKVVRVFSGDWERPLPFHVTLPSDWVKEHTVKGDRQVEIRWVEDHLELRGVT